MNVIRLQLRRTSIGVVVVAVEKRPQGRSEGQRQVGHLNNSGVLLGRLFRDNLHARC